MQEETNMKLEAKANLSKINFAWKYLQKAHGREDRSFKKAFHANDLLLEFRKRGYGFKLKIKDQ